jgi:hypothetical protein
VSDQVQAVQTAQAVAEPVITEALTTAPTPTPTPTPEASKTSAASEPTSLLTEAAPAPEAFDPEKLALPEGMNKDDALWEDFTKLAKEHGLSGPAAQTMIDLAAKQVQSVSQKLQASWDKQNEDWQAEIKADKDIGGDKLNGTLQTFAKVASNPELSDPKFREALAFTGAGNHPAIVRTLARWAKALSEGGPVQGGPAGESRVPETLGQAFYGPNGPHVGGPRLS